MSFWLPSNTDVQWSLGSGNSLIDAGSLLAGASNVIPANNPAYLVSDFLTDHKQFTGQIPETIITLLISIANMTISAQRYGTVLWPVLMGLYTAHMCVEFMKVSQTTPNSVQQVIAKASATGLKTSKSVGEVSVSHDFAEILKGYDGWGSFLKSDYGQLYATLIKPYIKGGMLLA